MKTEQLKINENENATQKKITKMLQKIKMQICYSHKFICADNGNTDHADDTDKISRLWRR